MEHHQIINFHYQFNFVEGFAESTKCGVKLLSLETFAELECLYNFNNRISQGYFSSTTCIY